MTEAEWLACIEPEKMLELLKNKASDRKLRLFAVACCRDIWDFLDDLGRGAVEMAELFADGLTGTEEMRAVRQACRVGGGRTVWYAAASDPFIAARNTVLSIKSGLEGKSIAQVNLLREIMGKPFRPMSIDSCWRTPTVIDLVSFIYNERAFDRLPNLAASLMDAGCDDAVILGHCRTPGIHARGCWLLDLLLDKE